jgi:MFS family permease
MNKWGAKVIEDLGLDLFPYALGRDLLDEDDEEKLPEVEAKLDGLDKKKLSEAISHAKNLLEQENQRGDAIESKAQNLLGVTGVATAFITWIAGLLPDKVIQLPHWQIVVSVILYIAIVIALVMTILLAFKVILVGKYRTVTPDINDIFTMASIPLDDSQRSLLAVFIYSHNRNQQVYNNKATYLIGSQIWFRNAIILFLILALVMALGLLTVNFTPVPPSIVPTQVVSPQPTITNSFTPVYTATLIPTKTNSATPTAQATLTPTITITQTPTLIPTLVPTQILTP